MTDESPLERELGELGVTLARLGCRFALVGGLAVSIRGEVRFTRDVDLAIDAPSDAMTESIVRDLRAAGYSIAAIVEHDVARRLSTVRLRSRAGVRVDLLAASSGIEHEIVEASEPVDIERAGVIPVATAEDLLATKVLAMSERRPQDGTDARNLILANPSLDLDRVRAQLDLIRARGFHRDQDLHAKLAAVLEAVSDPGRS